MICDRLLECLNKTHHVNDITDESRKKKKQRVQAKRSKQKKRDDVYANPLCGDLQCQQCCIEYLDCRTQPKCEEGKSYILDQSQVNPKHEVLLLHIDGGVITEPEASMQKKCDYAMVIRDGRSRQGDCRGKGNTVILIELKGKNVRTASKQLQLTIDQPEFKAAWETMGRMYGRIVCKSSIPRLRSEEMICLEEKLRDRGGNLKIREEVFLETYGEL